MTKTEMINECLAYVDCDTVDDYMDLGAMDYGPLDSLVPGCCSGCYHIEFCEPDATNNWCPVCEANMVASILVLIGVM